MELEDFDPLHGAAPEEIPLNAAPLATVLCQIRFTDIVQIRDVAFIGQLQERLRQSYPILKSENIQTVNVGPHGVQASLDPIWRFVDPAQQWRVSLGSSYVALDTSAYVSRVDFIRRLEFILVSMAETINPTHVWRIGMRYIDRVPMSKMGGIQDMLRPELAGIAGTSLLPKIQYSVTEVSCQVEHGALLVKSGILPANGSHEPEVMPAIAEPSWILDIDASYENSAKPVAYDVSDIVKSTEQHAARCYSFFRWSVSKNFLRSFGGNV